MKLKLFFNKVLICVITLVFLGYGYAQEKKVNLALNMKVEASSEMSEYPVSNIVDGKITRESKWMSATNKAPHVIEINLEQYCNIYEIRIHSGIPEDERTAAEKNQANGFWSVKNFNIQYWDDANWTDFPKASVLENRETTVNFSFKNPLSTFKIRMVADDGEKISVMEIEVLGNIAKDMPAPPSLDSDVKKQVEIREDQNLDIKVEKKEKLERPNILFIAVDDLRPELGCYGNKIVKTPNLDKLGSEGVIFKNHFVQVPTCGASRYSLITGMRPRNKMQLQNNVVELEISNNKENKKRPESFIHQLRRNGYYTVGIGKITHSPDGFLYGYEEESSNKRELPYSWDELVFNTGKWGTGWNSFFAYANGENRQSLKSLVKPYEMAEVNDEGYPDGLTANLAIAKLKELKQKSQPFFMGVGFFKPHLPFNAPKKYWDLYDRDSIPIALNSTIPKNVNLKSLHNSNEFNRYKLSDEKMSLKQKASEAYAKKLKHAYYASVSYIDHQIGKVLDELDTLGLKENTIIILWGDHGWHLGEQQVWGKHTLFDNALRSPLIIKAPNYRYLQGKKINSVVETVDIYPSIFELCNIKMPYKTDGNSFIDLFEDKEDLQDEVAFSYYNNGISMRTNRYRITKYFREEEPTIELYDHVHDPFETINIALVKPNIVDKLLPLLENVIFKF